MSPNSKANGLAEIGFAERIYPTAMLVALLNPLRHWGLSPEKALAAAGLTDQDVTSPATLVSVDQILAVYAVIVGELSDPLLAYRLGLAFHVTTYGMYGFALLSSADAGQAFDIALRYHRLGSPLMALTLAVDGASAIWAFEPVPHSRISGALYEFVIRLHVGIFAALYGDVMGDGLEGVRAGLSYALTREEAAIVKPVIGLELEPARGRRSWIRFDAARLSHPTRMGSPAVNQMLLAICDEQMEGLRRRQGLAGRVRTVLIANGCRVLGLDSAARRLGLSERSLRRRLVAEGTSYRAVHDDVQRQAAIGYLRDTHLTVEAIADLLGFSDAANFRRAFRRWTDQAPLYYRSACR